MSWIRLVLILFIVLGISNGFVHPPTHPAIQLSILSSYPIYLCCCFIFLSSLSLSLSPCPPVSVSPRKPGNKQLNPHAWETLYFRVFLFLWPPRRTYYTKAEGSACFLCSVLNPTPSCTPALLHSCDCDGDGDAGEDEDERERTRQPP